MLKRQIAQDLATAVKSQPQVLSCENYNTLHVSQCSVLIPSFFLCLSQIFQLCMFEVANAYDMILKTEH